MTELGEHVPLAWSEHRAEYEANFPPPERCPRSGSNPTDAEWQWRAGNETTCADCLWRVRLVTLNSSARRRTAHYLDEHATPSGRNSPSQKLHSL